MKRIVRPEVQKFLVKMVRIGRMRQSLLVAAALFFCCALQAQGPSISGLSPSSGPVGTVVTITGTNFGPSQGLTSSVTFGGIVAAGRGRPAQSWTATTIKVAVPGGATTSNVVVTVGGQPSNGVTFTVIPVIQSLSPTSGLAGTVVNVSGTGFGNTPAQGPSTVAFNGLAATPSTWSSTSFTVPVPSGASAGNVVVTVGGQASNGVLFTPTPVISSLIPNSGLSGTQVTIAGSSFGDQQGNSTVTFNGVSAAVTSWNNKGITVNAPSGALSGNVVVAVNGVQSAGQTFTYTPQITGISPNPALAQSLVTVAGGNFGGSQGSSTVTFNGVAAVVNNWNNASISAIVPGNVTQGNVIVTVNGVSSNGIAFSLPPLYSFSLGYAPNGSVVSANDSVNGNWAYSYDDFNRLSAASNSSPHQGFSYTYDQYGNRWHQDVTAGSGGTEQLTFTPAATATTNGNCYHAAGMTNQPDGFCFDAAGNLLNDGQGHTYTYDAENRMVQVDGGQTASYTYDAGGQRIQKVTPSGTAVYLYDLSDRLITELDAFGTWTRGEIYAEGRHLATYGNGANGTTYFIQTDWLRTERTRVLPSGDLFETCASLAFGDGLTCNGSADPSPDHLTGKQRDTETNLDYFGARFYSSAMGRFVTPDWAEKPATVPYAHFADPQSLNLYSYVNNTPVSGLDPDGHELGDFLDRIWQGIRHSGCGLFSGCLTQAEYERQQALDKQERGAASRLSLIKDGFDFRQVLRLTDQQAIDASGAHDLGKQEFTSDGRTFKFLQIVVQAAATIYATKADARQAFSGKQQEAANRFFKDATSKSQDFKTTPLENGGQRLEFFSPARNPGYGKRYVQEIDANGTALREYKDTIGPNGLIERKWLKGGP